MPHQSSLRARLAVLAAIAVVMASCDQRAGPSQERPPAPPAPVDPEPAAELHLELLEPSGDIVLARGATTIVTLTAVDPLAKASVRLLLDGDGDHSTVSDQYELTTISAGLAATPQEVAATLPADMAFGSYSILGTIDDGIKQPRHARAPGRLHVDAAHSLQINAPATDLTVSRGGSVTVSFIATDADGSADIRFFADVDGNLITTADQYLLSSITTSSEATQSTSLDLAPLPPGMYRILGAAMNVDHPDFVATAAGRVQVASVGFALSEGGTDYEEGRAIAAAPDGALVVAGRFAGSSLFGEWPTFTSLNSAGDDDAFLGRYAPDGTLTWVRQIGGPSRGEWGSALGCFADGSVLLGGYFHGLATFNGSPLAAGVLSAGEDDAFLARYSSSGSLQWVKRAGGIFHDSVAGVAVFTDGSFVATGRFTAQGTFGEGASTAVLQVAGSLLTSDGFVARYDGDGALLWVRQFGGAAGDDLGLAVATSADGSCTVVGSFLDTATFGEGTTQVTLTSAGGLDMFVARYDAAGALLWARRGGGPGDDQGRGISRLPSGDFVVCGSYAGMATFGDAIAPQTLQATGVTGARDAFVARFGGNGSLTWVRSAGGANDDEAMGVSASTDGSCLVTGYFHTFATFRLLPSPKTLTSFGLRDVFLARYDGNGTLVWVERAGGSNHDIGYGIATLPDGSCGVTGSFHGDATFGADSAVHSLSANGVGDVFVARFNADGAF